MSSEQEARQYHAIITAVWQEFKQDIAIVNEITNSNDKRWVALCDRYDKICDDAPDAVKSYAFGMVQMHVAELEKRWRWKH